MTSATICCSAAGAAWPPASSRCIADFAAGWLAFCLLGGATPGALSPSAAAGVALAPEAADMPSGTVPCAGPVTAASGPAAASAPAPACACSVVPAASIVSEGASPELRVVAAPPEAACRAPGGAWRAAACPAAGVCWPAGFAPAGDRPPPAHAAPANTRLYRQPLGAVIQNAIRSENVTP